MSSKYQIAGISVSRGEKKFGYLDIATMASGLDLKIGIHAIAGAKPGPTLCLLGVEHGDETLGIDIIREVMNSINPKDLTGQLVAIPVVNPLSFAAQTYNTPEDMKNIHLAFPGNMEDSLTDKMAYIITHQVIDNVNCILNLHGGGTHTVNNFIYVPNLPGEIGKEVIELAKVFGSEVLYLGPTSPVWCTSYAAGRGVPGITTEIGSDVMWAPEVEKFVKIGLRGVLNVLKHMKMITGKPEKPARQVLLKNRKTIKSRHGGMFYPQFGLEVLGKTVPKGTLLGSIVNPQTFKELEEIITPYDEGIIFLIRGRSRVHPGDYVFHVGDMKTAEWII